MADEAVPNPAPAPAPTQTPTNTPAPAPVQPPAAPQPELTAMLMQRLTASELRTAELEAAERRRKDELARSEQDRLAAQGNTEAARAALDAARAAHDAELAAERGQRAEVDRRSRTAFRDRELALALSGNPLVPGAAPQLVKLWRDSLDAHPEGEGYSVRTADFVGVNEFVARELAKPEYAHFLTATNRGGVNPGGNAPAPTPKPGDALTPQQRITQQLKDTIAGNRSAPGLAGNYGAPGLSGSYAGNN